MHHDFAMTSNMRVKENDCHIKNENTTTGFFVQSVSDTILSFYKQNY